VLVKLVYTPSGINPVLYEPHAGPPTNVVDNPVPAPPMKRYQPAVKFLSQYVCTVVYVIRRVGSLLFVYVVHCAGRTIKKEVLEKIY
jgi:hypothetical protein